MSNIPELILTKDSRAMPVVGLGTATYPFAPENTESAIVNAIEIGYRHFDTASLYCSEEPLGKAMVEALKLGLIKSRGELFITSKLWCNEAHPDLVVPSIKRSLRNLKMEYLDLYLIHMPFSTKRDSSPPFPVNGKDIVAMDMEGVWKAMEECQRLGMAKAIGVSNFTVKKLEELLSVASIPPSVNQVEMNPTWQQKKLREYCNAKGIHVTAYSPLGGQDTLVSPNMVVKSEVLKEIANARGKTPAQICSSTSEGERSTVRRWKVNSQQVKQSYSKKTIRLVPTPTIMRCGECICEVSLRWVYEQGVSMVVKSFNKERIKENIEIFDWNLSEEECRRISQIPQCKRVTVQTLISNWKPHPDEYFFEENEDE